MADPGPLHRSAEIEDLTHLTDEDKKKINESKEQTGVVGSLHRSAEMEDLAHIPPQEINKPLTTEPNSSSKQ